MQRKSIILIGIGIVFALLGALFVLYYLSVQSNQCYGSATKTNYLSRDSVINLSQSECQERLVADFHITNGTITMGELMDKVLNNTKISAQEADGFLYFCATNEPVAETISRACGGPDWWININGTLSEVPEKEFNSYINQYNTSCNGCLITTSIYLG